MSALKTKAELIKFLSDNNLDSTEYLPNLSKNGVRSKDDLLNLKPKNFDEIIQDVNLRRKLKRAVATEKKKVKDGETEVEKDKSGKKKRKRAVGKNNIEGNEKEEDGKKIKVKNDEGDKIDFAPEIVMTSVKNEHVESIEINRAPVMALWGTVIAERLGFNYQEALSLASVVTGLNAYSKGKSLGIYHEKEEKDKAKRKKIVSREVFLLGRPVPNSVISEKQKEYCLGLRNDKIVQPLQAYHYLKGKFGDTLENEYIEFTKLAEKIPLSLLQMNKNRVAYDMYCEFRPDVSKGKAGWGAKGKLDFEKLEKMIKSYS